MVTFNYDSATISANITSQADRCLELPLQRLISRHCVPIVGLGCGQEMDSDLFSGNTKNVQGFRTFVGTRRDLEEDSKNRDLEGLVASQG